MLRSWRMGRIFQIETSIHWSFWLLILWVLLSAASEGGLAQGLSASFFLIAVFVCVYLHELGHAFAAKHYGIRTLSITMLPIGGIARLERIPQLAWQELWISLAGPLVNVVIASALGLGLFLRGELAQLQGLNVFRHTFLEQLLIVNLGLAIFNLFPALPMDGGRVLRSLLQFRMSRLQATEIASRLSRYLALLMILSGLFYYGLPKGFTLILIGIFVLIAGFQELVAVRVQAWQEKVNAEGWDGSMPGGDRVWFETRFGSETRYAPNPFDEPNVPRHGPDQILDADDIRRIE